MAVPKVALIVTGGTIDSLGADRLDLAWYIEAGKRLDEGQLVGSLPELGDIAAVEEVPFRRLPSHALVDRDWLDMVELLHGIFEGDGADGVVITHGTNTLEETAYFLNLVLKTDRPVVLVGSMRPASALSADGYLNLINAVRVAAEPESQGYGVLVVMNDRIYGARDLTKTATYRVEAFQGRGSGPFGFCGRGQPRALLPPLQQEAHHRDRVRRGGVGVVAAGGRGPVIRGSGRRHDRSQRGRGSQRHRLRRHRSGAGPLRRRMRPSTGAGEKGVMMCLSSRVGSGRVVRSPSLRRRGFVAADNLQPWKARVLLALALGVTDDPDAIQRMFDTY